METAEKEKEQAEREIADARAQLEQCQTRVKAEQRALEALQQMGLHPRQLLRQVERKHIFTHIQWNLRGYYLEVAERDGSFQWFSREEIRNQAALPTAFRQFWEEIDHV